MENKEKNISNMFLGELLDIDKAPEDLIDLYRSINESFLLGTYICDGEKQIAIVPKIEYGRCITDEDYVNMLLKYTLAHSDISFGLNCL